MRRRAKAVLRVVGKVAASSRARVGVAVGGVRAGADGGTRTVDRDGVPRNMWKALYWLHRRAAHVLKDSCFLGFDRFHALVSWLGYQPSAGRARGKQVLLTEHIVHWRGPRRSEL